MYFLDCFFQEGDPIKSSIPVPKILLKIFPFMKRLFGVSSDLIVPIQDFIKVILNFLSLLVIILILFSFNIEYNR